VDRLHVYDIGQELMLTTGARHDWDSHPGYQGGGSSAPPLVYPTILAWEP